MDKTVIGIALFALVIVVGLIIGLRMSSPGPQRKAVGIAFGLMAIIAALFYVCAIVFSLPWSAPVFAVAAIVVPIATYTIIVHHAKAPITVSRRNPNDPPRPPRNENRVRADQASSSLEPSGAPAASNPPVSDYADYPQDEDDDELFSEDEFEFEIDEPEEDEEPAMEPEPVSAELAEAFIDEYLVGENEIEDGFFEPEPSPTLRPHKEPDPVVSSSMVVTVPHPEGNERFLVVSESREPANPILAYRRTTSSHLVHLGVAKDGEDNEAPLIAAALAAQRATSQAAPADDAFDFDTFEPEEARMPVSVPAAQPAAAEEVVEAPAAAVAMAAGEDDFEFERAPKHARAKHAPKPAVEMAPARELEPAPAPEPAVATRPELELATPAPTAAVAPAPDFSFSLETMFAPEPERAPEPAYEPLPLFDLQATEAPEPMEVAERSAAAPAATPTPQPASQPAPAAAAAAPAPQPVAAPKPELTPFESYMAKAEGLRAKGVFAMAARIYNEAAIAADSTADNHRARFEEIACYVAAGQGEKAQAVAATLRASSVLTKVERFKLSAIERMA